MDLSRYYETNYVASTLARTAGIADTIAGSFDQINSEQNIITSGASSLVSDRLTINKALTTDGVGKVSASRISNIELGHLSCVNANI